MKKLNKVAVLFAAAALAAPAAVFAQAKSVDNWRAADGTVWKNGSNELCWRDAGWTPANADDECDGAIKPPPPPPPAPRMAPPPPPPVVAPPAPVVTPAPPPPPPPPPAPVREKVSFAADGFFDSGKSVVKPDTRAKLDDLADKVKGVSLEVIILVGHTDSVGSPAMNQRLSVSRADAMKKYLVSKGIEANRIYTEGKGESNPIADNKTAAGRAKNRRVEVEVVGTRMRQP